VVWRKASTLAHTEQDASSHVALQSGHSPSKTRTPDNAGVECRKDVGVLDEIPGAYKSIEAVMKNQEDLVEVVAEIKQVVCVKARAISDCGIRIRISW
jgi:RNA-splicing ligase RtcB